MAKESKNSNRKLIIVSCGIIFLLLLAGMGIIIALMIKTKAAKEVKEVTPSAKKKITLEDDEKESTIIDDASDVQSDVEKREEPPVTDEIQPVTEEEEHAAKDPEGVSIAELYEKYIEFPSIEYDFTEVHRLQLDDEIIVRSLEDYEAVAEEVIVKMWSKLCRLQPLVINDSKSKIIPKIAKIIKSYKTKLTSDLLPLFSVEHYYRPDLLIQIGEVKEENIKTAQTELVNLVKAYRVREKEFREVLSNFEEEAEKIIENLETSEKEDTLGVDGRSVLSEDDESDVSEDEEIVGLERIYQLEKKMWCERVAIFKRVAYTELTKAYLTKRKYSAEVAKGITPEMPRELKNITNIWQPVRHMMRYTMLLSLESVIKMYAFGLENKAIQLRDEKRKAEVALQEATTSTAKQTAQERKNKINNCTAKSDYNAEYLDLTEKHIIAIAEANAKIQVANKEAKKVAIEKTSGEKSIMENVKVQILMLKLELVYDEITKSRTNHLIAVIALKEKYGLGSTADKEKKTLHDLNFDYSTILPVFKNPILH